MRLSRFLIGTGFSWMMFWSIAGSLIGARINLVASSAETTWLQSWERTLLRTAHAHMNLMSITLILMGLTYVQALGLGGQKLVSKTCAFACASLPIFGLGLVLEAYFPPQSGSVSLVTAVTALGGIVYILCIAIWGALFLFGAMRK
jgi:hypothetical protein